MGFYSRLFLVPKKGDSFRPVIDLSHLNKFIANEHFQMENLTCIKHLLNVNEYMVKLDLKDAYLTVGVHPESRKFLRFVWLGQTYQFLALPFGLNTAPRIFTKLLKPVVAYLRTRNIRLLIYLDDILIIGSSVQILREHTALVIELLQNLGFIINYEKSLLTPTPVLEFLGFLINSKTMKFYLPQTKVAKVLDSPEGESNLTTPSRSASGFPRVLSTSSVVSPLALQASTELFNPTSSVEQGVVSGHRPPRPPSSRGAPVVDHQHQTGEWKPNSPPSDRDGDHLRRLQDGVGCHLRQSVNQRTLVKAGKRPPYQRLRAKSDLFSDTSFSEKSVESSGETPSRQHNSSDVCQQPRRYSITQSHVIDTRTVELVPTTQHSDHCRTPPGCLECPGRQRVADIYRFQRLETTTRNNTIFPQGQRDRSLRHKTDQSIKELATRPTCCGDGRFFNRLESDERICVSTNQSRPTDINEGYKRQCELT